MQEKYGTKGCYAYSTGNYAGSVYFGMGGTDEENNAVPDPPKYRFCCPNKTDPTSARYIEAEEEAACISEARDACVQSPEAATFDGICRPGIMKRANCTWKPGNDVCAANVALAKLYKRTLDSCMARKY